jgi:nitrate/nitrite-specific signal transduction histidine kinase
MPIGDLKFQGPTRDNAETALRELTNQLESRVQARTEELEEKNQRSQFYLSQGQLLTHTGSWALDPAGFFDYWTESNLRDNTSDRELMSRMSNSD